MRRTRYGLTLVSERGEWKTEDRAQTIGRAREITMCDNAHPMRERGPDGVVRSTHCPGGQDHDRECGWVIVNPYLLGLDDDLYESLDDAWGTLAHALEGGGSRASA